MFLVLSRARAGQAMDGAIEKCISIAGSPDSPSMTLELRGIWGSGSEVQDEPNDAIEKNRWS